MEKMADHPNGREGPLVSRHRKMPKVKLLILKSLSWTVWHHEISGSESYQTVKDRCEKLIGKLFGNVEERKTPGQFDLTNSNRLLTEL